MIRWFLYKTSCLHSCGIKTNFVFLSVEKQYHISDSSVIGRMMSNDLVLGNLLAATIHQRADFFCASFSKTPCPLPDDPTLFSKHFGKTVSPYLGLADNQRKQARDEPLEVDTQLFFAPDVDFVSLGFNGPHDFFGANLRIHPGG